MATQNKTWERWSDEEVSALLAIYSEDANQQLLLKPVPSLFCVRVLLATGCTLRVCYFANRLHAEKAT